MIDRPVLKYFGGKFQLREWISGLFPDHEIYVEPYAGAASLLMCKPRSRIEVINDLNGEIANLFKVLRDDSAGLIELLELTPYSRDEYILAEQTEKVPPIEEARRTIVRYWFSIHRSTGFRKYTLPGTYAINPPAQWDSWKSSVPDFVERLRGVMIENQKGVDVMFDHDSEETLHFVDPPYLPETRRKKSYDFEMTREDHVHLLKSIKCLKGLVLICGYDNDLYSQELSSWHREERECQSAGRSNRKEVIWLSPSCPRPDEMPAPQFDLFKQYEAL